MVCCSRVPKWTHSDTPFLLLFSAMGALHFIIPEDAPLGLTNRNCTFARHINSWSLSRPSSPPPAYNVPMPAPILQDVALNQHQKGFIRPKMTNHSRVPRGRMFSYNPSRTRIKPWFSLDHNQVNLAEKEPI